MLTAEIVADLQFLSTADGGRKGRTPDRVFDCPLEYAGDPVVIVGGGHVGCFELFGSEKVRAIRDLKVKARSIA